MRRIGSPYNRIGRATLVKGGACSCPATVRAATSLVNPVGYRAGRRDRGHWAAATAAVLPRADEHGWPAALRGFALPAAIVLTIILALFNVAGIVGFALSFVVCFVA